MKLKTAITYRLTYQTRSLLIYMAYFTVYACLMPLLAIFLSDTTEIVHSDIIFSAICFMFILALIGINSDFKLSGFPDCSIPVDHQMVTLTEANRIEYVIKNKSATLLYSMIYKLFATHDIPLEEVMDQAKLALPVSHINVRELLVRNKIREISDRRLKPDWTQENVLYRIETIANSIDAAPSISLKLGGGAIIKRTENVYYHKAELMKPSSYDILYTTEDDDVDDNK